MPLARTRSSRSTTCPVSEPALLAALPVLAELAEIGASRKGTLRVTVTAGERGLDVAAEGGKPVEGPLYGQLVAVAATRDLARLSWEGEALVTRRQPVQRMGPRLGRAAAGRLSAGDRRMARRRWSRPCARRAAGAARIADLFAGSGTFALPLAEAAEVYAADADAGALAALDAGWRAAEGLRRIETERRDLWHRPLLARELNAFGAVVFDPPRAGAGARPSSWRSRPCRASARSAATRRPSRATRGR